MITWFSVVSKKKQRHQFHSKQHKSCQSYVLYKKKIKNRLIEEIYIYLIRVHLFENWKTILQKKRINIIMLSSNQRRLYPLTYRNGLRMSKKVEASGSDAIKNFGATQNESRYMFTVILALIYSVILRWKWSQMHLYFTDDTPPKCLIHKISQNAA